MPRVTFAPHLRRHVDLPPLQVPAPVGGITLRQALEAAFASAPALRDYVLDEQGALRKHVIVFINAQRSRDRERLGDLLAEHDDVHVFQALTGG